MSGSTRVAVTARTLLLAVALGLLGCAAPAAQGSRSAAQAAAPPTTLVMVVNTEVSNLWPKAVGPTSPGRTTRIFNANLTLTDAQGTVRPYLAESLPQLNTDSWRVFPDGRMETTWTLRSGLTWHDGEPVTADDFTFAFQVYIAPGLAGVFSPKPQNLIERLVAVDSQTVRIDWRSPFLHTGDGLDPLPRVRLSEPFGAFEQDPIGQRDAFLSLRFWTTEYVGAGPYRLTSWEPASQIQGAAFDGHALNRARIDRVVIRFINNENTALANLMAGQVDFIMADVIGFERGMILRREGGFNDVERKGTLLPTTTAVITAVAQHRPDYQQTPGLLDLRVRKAIAHAIDKNAINEGLFEGQAPLPSTFVPPDAPYYPQVERVISRYPYDPSKTGQLISEAGYSKGRDGFFLDSAGQRFQPAFWNSAGPQQDLLLPILVNTWQRAGIDVQPLAMPNALERDQQARATFPGILVHGIPLGESSAANALTSDNIATPANRWSGSNRGGWSNPEYDRLWERYNSTLVRSEQIQAFIDMMKLQSEQVPNFPLYYLVGVVAHRAGLEGPDGVSSHWNIHEWELTN